MWFFLALYFGIYGGMNFWFLFNARRALGIEVTGTIAISLFLMLMLFAPFVTRIFVRLEYFEAASKAGFIGFTWMGLVFSFLFASFVLHALVVPNIVLAWWKGTIFSIGQFAKPLFFLPCLYMVFVFIIGYQQGSNLQLAEHTLTLKTSLSVGPNSDCRYGPNFVGGPENIFCLRGFLKGSM